MLTRLLIRVRWLMVAAALLTLGAMVASRFLVAYCKVPLGSTVPGIGVELDGGDLNLYQSDSGHIPDAELSVVFQADKSYVMRPTWDRNSLSFALRWTRPHRIPLWSLAIPLMGMAALGFWLKHRPRSAGRCIACGHPLAGAAICPECGRTALPN